MESGKLRVTLVDPAKLETYLEPALEKLIAAEAEITKYDSVVGDGDCGIGLKRGAEAILKVLPTISSEDAAVAFAKIVSTVEKNMDGTSGALYAIFLNSLASNVKKQDASSPGSVTMEIWAKALTLSLEGLAEYTPAQPGDRTLMDALAPFVSVLNKTRSVKEAASAAKEGAEKTKGMKASLGRSVYVGGTGFEEVPDPGAYGLSVFLSGLADALQ